MKASELVKRLNDLIDVIGDVDVVINDPYIDCADTGLTGFHVENVLKAKFQDGELYPLEKSVWNLFRFKQIS